MKEVQTAYGSEWLPNGYNPLGNVEKVERRDQMGELHKHFSYDALSQLTNEQGVEEHTYSYTTRKSRFQVDGERTAINLHEELLYQQGVNYQYDRNGNVVAMKGNGKELTLRYDGIDRLVEVVCNATYKTRYTYLGEGKRVQKISYVREGATWHEVDHECYLYDGGIEIGAMTPVREWRQLRVVGIGKGAEAGAAVALELYGHLYLPIHDLQGNTMALVDGETHSVVESYRYTAFGKEQIFDSHGSQLEGTQIGNPWRFACKRVDEESGLLFFTHRYYSPEMGRWITRDPAGAIDGPNRYAYVHNNPLRFSDPWGLYAAGDSISFDELLEMYPAPEGVDKEEHYEQCRASYIVHNEPKEFHYVYKEHGSLMRRYPNYEKGLTQKSERFKINKSAEKGPFRGVFVNGIMTSRKESKNYGKTIYKNLKDSLGTDFRMDVIYNASHGFVDDVWKCRLLLHKFGLTPACLLMHDYLDDFKKNKEPDEKLFIVCHSQGAIVTRNALMSYRDQELLNNVYVYAVAPGARIPDGVCAQTTHIIQNNDVVPKLDRAGKRLPQSRIDVLFPNKEDSTHSFTSSSHQDALIQWIHYDFQ